MSIQKYQTKEVLNKVLNAGGDALKVDLEGANINATVDVQLDATNDSVECIQDTPADLNATVNLITGFATSALQGPPTAIGDGRQTDDTSRTQFSAQACTKVDITAELDNTDVVVIGGSGVVAALSTRTGTPLNAGDSYSLTIDDMDNLYIQSIVSGEGVTFTYFA